MDARLTALLKQDAPVAVTEPVAMEVLAGARDDIREQQLHRLLLRFELARFDAGVDFSAAVRIYGRCRHSGVTPPGLIDCTIAAVAWRHAASLSCYDKDLSLIAGVIGIEMDPASLRT